MENLEARSMVEHRAKDLVVHNLGFGERIRFQSHGLLFILLAVLELLSLILLVLILQEQDPAPGQFLKLITNVTIQSDPEPEKRHVMVLLILYGFVAPQFVVLTILLDQVLHWRLALSKCIAKSMFLIVFYVIALHTLHWSEVDTSINTVLGLRLHSITIVTTSGVIWIFLCWSFVELIRIVAPKLANIRVAGYILQIVRWNGLKDSLHSLVHAAIYLSVLVGLVCLGLCFTPSPTKISSKCAQKPILILLSGFVTILLIAFEITLRLYHHLLNHTKSLSYSQFKEHFGQFKGLYDPKRIFHVHSGIDELFQF